MQAAVDEALRQQARRWRRALLWVVPLVALLVGLIAFGASKFGERPFGIALLAVGAVFLPSFLGVIGMGGAAPDWEVRGEPFPKRRVALFAAGGLLLWVAVTALLVV